MGQRKVLLVEDDDDIRSGLREILELEGYDSIEATNGKEALEHLTTANDVCLILCDLMMPVMNGWELLSQLTIHHPDILARTPLIIVSAAGEKAQSLAHQVTGIIKKPVDLDVLMELVNKYCTPA